MEIGLASYSMANEFRLRNIIPLSMEFQEEPIIELNTKSKVTQIIGFSETSLEGVKNVLPYPKILFY